MVPRDNPMAKWIVLRDRRAATPACRSSSGPPESKVEAYFDPQGEPVYSISCLAAHPAIEAILAGVGFEKRDRGDKGFVHTELRTDETDVRKLVNNLVEATAQTARVAAFRCRSRKTCSTTIGTPVAGTGRVISGPSKRYR